MSGTITIQYCDIEKIPTECMVNAANTGLHYGTGVCHAIFSGAGMYPMTEACNQIGHCDVGSAVVTPAFNLPAQWVIHAVGPYTSDPDAVMKLWETYISAMRKVMELGCHKVTFPLISSGAFNDMNLSFEPLWNAAISAVQSFQATYPDYNIDVLFACHGHQLIDVGKRVLASPPAVRLIDGKSGRWDEEIHSSQDQENLITRYRIYVSPSGGFRDSGKYTFIAEFGQEDLVRNRHGESILFVVDNPGSGELLFFSRLKLYIATVIHNRIIVFLN